MKKTAYIKKEPDGTGQEKTDMKPNKNQEYHNTDNDNAFNFVDNEIAIIMNNSKLTKN